MKTIPHKFRAALIRDLRKLRAELKNLRENPPQHRDPLDAFRAVFRDSAKDKPSR